MICGRSILYFSNNIGPESDFIGKASDFFRQKPGYSVCFCPVSCGLLYLYFLNHDENGTKVNANSIPVSGTHLRSNPRDLHLFFFV